ncbi:MAG: long-chain fatty acid--CoA ligase [Dethiobacter sp.]|jgi:long-chain acyl-CoA synthetase|nr:MAG: long-chain fatty acid--CoA ligase [Dethiobacter sp.]
MLKKYCHSIDEAFRNTVEQYPDKEAIIFRGNKLTFAELEEQVDKLAGGLYSKGVRRQDRVIIYLPHMPQWIVIWLALQRIGAVAVPVTHFYGHAELSYIAKDSGAETVFCADTNLGQAIKASASSSLKRIIVVGSIDLTEFEESNMEKTDILTFESFLSNHIPSLPTVKIAGKDTAEILYTGGTTGVPKGVPIPNMSFLEAITESRKASESLVPLSEAITIQGAPLNHIFGQEVGLGALLSGDTLILLPRLELDDLLFHIEKYRATTLFGTPTLCKMILDYDQLDNYNLDSLLYVFTGGEALPVEVLKRWFQRFGKHLYHGYGSSETCGAISLIPAGEPFPEGTAGKIISTKKIKLVNPDTLEPVSSVEPGELLVSSENMVTRYWNNPEETARHFINLYGCLWYKTGDIVKIDSEGWVFFVDRSVDLIKHKGYRVAATKVEAVLYKHNVVGECCVVGVPDARVGEKIKAFVVLKAGVGDVTAEDLIKWCSENLSSYEVPHCIEFRNTLPKSAVGKLLRRKLRDEER